MVGNALRKPWCHYHSLSIRKLPHYTEPFDRFDAGALCNHNRLLIISCIQ